jgi:Anti-sigma-28 factor, FlgM
LKSDSFNLNRLQKIDMKKVEALKKAVSEGTYTVPAEDSVPKLMESLFRNTILDETSIGVSISQLEAEDQHSPQHTDAPEIASGAMVNRKDSHLASMHRTDRLAGADRNVARAGTAFGPTPADGDDLEGGLVCG